MIIPSSPPHRILLRVGAAAITLLILTGSMATPHPEPEAAAAAQNELDVEHAVDFPYDI